MRQRQSHDSLDKHPTGRTPVRLCRRRSFRDWHCVPISMTTGVLPGVGTKRQSPSSRKNGGFTASAVKCWPQLTASKTLFQELARSANLQAAGKRPVSQRQLQNGRLPYDVQGLFSGVGTQCQSPPNRKKCGFAPMVRNAGFNLWPASASSRS